MRRGRALARPDRGAAPRSRARGEAQAAGGPGRAISRPRTRRRWTTSAAAACSRGTPAAASRSAATAPRWPSARRTKPRGAKGVNGNQRDNSVFEAGAVYVYTRSGSGWTQQAYLKASNPQMSAGFGHYVALSDDGNTLAVSAYWESSNAKGINGNQQDESIPQAGAVYVFTRQGAAWSQQAYVKASNTGEAGTADAFGEGDQFGFSLALSGDGATLAVGALTEDGGDAGINGNQADNSAASAGAVYVFTRTGRAWSQQAYVKSSNIDAGDLFGYAVALSRDGSVLAVGAFDEDGSARQVNGPHDNRAAGSGAAYVFTRAGADVVAAGVHQAVERRGAGLVRRGRRARATTAARCWSARSTKTARPPASTPPGCDNDWRDDLSMGAAYVFVRSGATWSQQAFLKASNTGPNDWFGVAARAERRRQRGGHRRLARGRQRQGHQRQENDDAAQRGRRRLPVHADRDGLAPAGLHQGRQHRGVRRVRRLDRDGPERHDSGRLRAGGQRGKRDRRQPGGQQGRRGRRRLRIQRDPMTRIHTLRRATHQPTYRMRGCTKQSCT